METQHGMQARHYMRRAIALAGRGRAAESGERELF